MAAVDLVPVTIAPEAVEYVSAKGLRGEFEQILDHVRTSTPDLLAVQVTHEPIFPECPAGGEWVCVDAVRRGVKPPFFDDVVRRELGDWLTARFSPDVMAHFTVQLKYEPAA